LFDDCDQRDAAVPVAVVVVDRAVMVVLILFLSFPQLLSKHLVFFVGSYA